MTLQLQKGGTLNLSKVAGRQLSRVKVGLGWDTQSGDGHDFDLDATAFVLGTSGKLLSDSWLIFFNQLESPGGVVRHHGDNRTGEGDGDDEEITIDLPRLPDNAERIAIVVTIHEHRIRHQNFGQVRNSFVRVVDSTNGRELTRYDLQEDFGTETGVIFGEFFREGNDWAFRALGEGRGQNSSSVLEDICIEFGANV